MIIRSKENLTKSQQFSKYTFLLSIGIMLIHCVILAYFKWLQIPEMIIYEAGSVATYFFVSIMTYKKYYKILYYLTIGEICLQTVFAAWHIGFDFGFSFYSLILIPVIFYATYALGIFQTKNKNLPAFVFSGIAGATFLISCALFFYREPVYNDIETSKKFIGFMMNSVTSLLMLMVFSFIFSFAMKSYQLKLEQENKTLENMANVDYLTQLINRRRMEEKLNDAKKSADTYGTRFSVAMCDVDDFKSINDTYGHETGDRTLTHLTQIIKRQIRSNDDVCRWGGEEFLILITAERDVAVKAVERIRETIAQSSITLDDGQVLKKTMTFGVTEYRAGEVISEMVDRADEGLYEGKTSGKNKVVAV